MLMVRRDRESYSSTVGWGRGGVDKRESCTRTLPLVTKNARQLLHASTLRGRGRDEICFANYSWLKALFSQQHYSALINVLTLYIKQLHYSLNVTLMK